jgi:phthiocerol/phenolphthiocerol synthesis type-I polyketide synthase E
MLNETDRDRLSVAIVGMSCKFPGADSLDMYWTNLRKGVESVREFAKKDLLDYGVNAELLEDSDFIPYGARLDGSDLFASSFFGYSPREAELMDPQHRNLLECAWTALEDAGYAPQSISLPTAVFTSVSLSTYLIFNIQNHLLPGQDDEYFQSMIGCDKDFAATRISYKLNLNGPSVAVQTGCSSSLVAVHLAVQSLLTYQCDLAIVGGASIGVPQRTGYRYQAGGILSADGHSRAFDAKATGTIFGEGVGVVVLKRVEDARSDRDNLYAVVRGSAVNNDGRAKIGFTAPSIEGQAQVIRQALDISELSAEDIGYVEAHGTATELGDPSEVAALTKAFRMTTEKRQFCGLGSVKSSIGHLDAAAGIAGLIKTALMLKHRTLVKSVNYDTPNPAIDFENSPFYVVKETKEWTEPKILRAGVSSFGIGGTNAHVILEEHVAETTVSARQFEILSLSAKSQDELVLAEKRLCSYLACADDDTFPNVSYTLHKGREEFSHRRSVVCSSRREAIDILSSGADPRSTYGYAGINKEVSFMFPGGGTQYSKMGYELYEQQDEFRRQVDYCAELLYAESQIDFCGTLYGARSRSCATDIELRKPSIALPSIFITEFAMAKLLISRGINPSYLIGHSLGEYTAACLSGIFSLQDAISLVVLRGKLFEELPAGAMLSVYLPETKLRKIILGDLSIAAVNAPEQCVVSGSVASIEKMAVLLTDEDVDFARLHIDVAAHSSMVDPVLEEFGRFLRTLRLRPPAIPVMSNFTGTWITVNEAQDPQYWLRQLRETVRFADGVAKIIDRSNTFFIEVGPSHTLSAFVKSQRRENCTCSSMKHPRDDRSDIEIFHSVFAKAWTSGVVVNWNAFYEGELRQRTALPTYPFTRERHWVEPRQRQESVTPSQDISPSRDHHKAYVQAWERATVPDNEHMKSSSPETWLILVEDMSVGRLMHNIASRQNITVIYVEKGNTFARTGDLTYTVRIGASGDFEQLLLEVRDLHAGEINLIHMWSLNPQIKPELDRTRHQEQLSNGLYSVLLVLQAASRTAGLVVRRNFIVTSGTAQISGSEVFSPENGMLGPLFAVAMQEEPSSFFKVIDIDCNRLNPWLPSVKTLFAEITSSDVEPIVALRGYSRYVRRFRALALAPATATEAVVEEGSTYVIIGGLGNLGLVLAEFLGAKEKCKIVLTSRDDFPKPYHQNQWSDSQADQGRFTKAIDVIRRIEQAGSEITVARLDASDGQQMEKFIGELYRHHPHIQGIFYLAGVTGSEGLSLIQDIDPEKCAVHFSSKVTGTQMLQGSLENRDFGYCVMFSSTASILGGVGLAAYAMANSYMDMRTDEYYLRTGKQWISINWDAWLNGESSQAILSGKTSLDAYAVKQSDALSLLFRLIDNRFAGSVFSSSTDPYSRMQQLNDVTNHEHGPGEIREFRPRPSLASDFTEPSSEVEKQILTVWREVLGIEKIGIDDSFFELGGNSLIALRIVSRMQKRLSINVGVLSLFECPTIRTLAKKTSFPLNAVPTPDSGFERGKSRRKQSATARNLATLK